LEGHETEPELVGVGDPKPEAKRKGNGPHSEGIVHQHRFRDVLGLALDGGHLINQPKWPVPLFEFEGDFLILVFDSL